MLNVSKYLYVSKTCRNFAMSKGTKGNKPNKPTDKLTPIIRAGITLQTLHLPKRRQQKVCINVFINT